MDFSTNPSGMGVLDASGDVFLLLDAEGRIVCANEFARTLGARAGGPFAGVFDGAIEEKIWQALRSGSATAFERWDDDRDRWTEIRVFPVDSGFAILQRDIPSPGPSNSAPREQGLRRLADAMPQLVWSATSDGEILFFNEQWYRYTGLSPSLPPDRQMEMALHPDDLPRSRSLWEKATRRGETFEEELRFRAHDGEYRWHLTRMVAPGAHSDQVDRWFGVSTDIHDLKLTEEALAASESRFRIALSGAAITAYEQDRDLRYTWLYPVLDHYLNVFGRTDEEILPTDEGRELTEIKRRVLETGVGERQIIRASTRDGVHYYDLMVEPLRDSSGEIVGVTGAALDASTEQTAQRALAASEERFRLAIQKSPIPKIIHSEGGEISYASQAWVAATGFTIEETPTVEQWAAAVSRDPEPLIRALRSAFDQGDGDGGEEFRIQTRSGHERVCHLTSRSIGVDEQGRRLAVSAAIDVTEQKAIEDGLRFLTRAGSTLAGSLDADLALSTVAELAVPELADWCVVDVVEADGTVNRVAVVHEDPAKVEWAREMEARFPVDLSAPSGVGRVIRTGQSEIFPEITDAMLEVHAPEVIDAIRQAEIESVAIVPLISREGTMGAISFVSRLRGRYQRRDLPILEELARIGVLAVENSRLYRSMERELDVRSRVESEILLVNASLEERVQSRTQELEAANREMEGFTYSVSHDLRAPLRAIIATSMIVMEEAGDQLTPELQHLLTRQAASARKLGVLIDELLKLSRIARQAMRVEPVDLRLLAREVADELEADGRADGVEFVIQDGLMARGDPLLLRFVLLNLLENACKFSPEGGRVSVGAAGAEFFVRDEGIGFDMAYANKLFLPFERLVNDADYPGTGIGLANVHRIIQRHGGQIRAESEPGRGASFYFTLSD